MATKHSAVNATMVHIDVFASTWCTCEIARHALILASSSHKPQSQSPPSTPNCPGGQGGQVDVRRGPHESVPPQHEQHERVTDESRQAISGQTYTKRLEVKSSRMWLPIKSSVLFSLVVTTSSRTEETVDN